MKTRVSVLEEMGHPAPFALSTPLVLKEIDLEPPGPGEILVQIRAAGVCHSDLSVITGQRPRPMPMAIGHEASGQVQSLGEGVDDIQVGDHVVLAFVPSCGLCLHCLAGRPALCIPGGQANSSGSLLRGGRRMRNSNGTELHHHLGVSAFSDYVVVDRSSAVVIDNDVPFEIAAIFGCAMLTGCGAVRNTVRVQAGESVAVIGLGGVGQAAVLGAVVSQATVIIAIDPVASKRELALSLGATHACSPQEAAAVVASATNHLGVNYAVEAAGVVPALEQAFALTAKGGTTVSVGLPSPTAVLSLPAVSFVAEAKSIVGSYMGSSVPQRDIPMMIDLWKQGKLPVDRLMSGTLPLSRVNEAMDLLTEGAVVRQILLP